MESHYEKEWERRMNPHWRGKGRGSKKRTYQEQGSRKLEDCDTESHQGRGEREYERARHPPGLQGREIGLWYSRQNRGKRNNTARNEEYKNRVSITMDRNQEQRISNLLRDIQSGDVTSQDPRRYETPMLSEDESDESPVDNPQLLTVKPEPCSSAASNFDYLSITSQKLVDVCGKNDFAVNSSFPDDQIPDNQIPDDQSDAAAGNFQKATAECSASHIVTSHFAVKDDDIGNDDNDDDEVDAAEFDEEYDDIMANIDPSDFDDDSAEGQVAELYFEEGNREDAETFTGSIDTRSEEEETSKFMFEFYKDRKEKDIQAPKQQRYHSVARDKDLDRIFFEQLKSKESDEAYKRMLQWRQKLPCYEKKQEILDAISKNQVVVICGETGCGKTTQVTQFILDNWITNGDGSLCRVVCTQPRRISAISIAERVADERAEALGVSVGYQIRLEAKTPRKQGSILYCTTGIMLKWLESDPWLASTSHIILDEVHERDILCDFLMIILRDLVQKRRDLKLILMSATLNAEMFSAYFGNCPMVNIPGYTFPVKEHFLEDVVEMLHFMPSKTQCKAPKFRFRGKNMKEERQKMNEYQQWISEMSFKKYCRNTIDVLQNMTFDSSFIDYDLVTALIHFIILNRPDGAILVFVPGWEQIRKVMDNLGEQPIFNSKNFRIIPLHSLMPTVNQREIFERPPPGKHKIVIATNIAETSITIEDVVYVIDCGTMKMKKFDAKNNLSTLQPEWISRANAKQRRGRAGRVCAGECFHLYTTFHEAQLEDFQQPEMLRTRLEELCLQIKLLKFGRIKEFVSKAMQPPSLDSLQMAICTLRDLNAFDANEELTALGYHLAKMPVDPHSGKMLLFAAMFSCLDPVLTVAASLSFKDAFYVPMGHEKTADERKRQLANKAKSDHLVLINAYEGWEKAKAYGNVYNYCRFNYLSVNTLQMLQNMRKQFSQLLFEMGFTVNSDPKASASNRNTGNVNLIQAIVCAGLYPNVAKLKPIKNIHSKRPLSLHTKCDQSVFVHPKSVNFCEREFSSQWFVYHLKMKTKKKKVPTATLR